MVKNNASDVSMEKGNSWHSINNGEGFYAVTSFGNTVWAARAGGKVGRLEGHIK